MDNAELIIEQLDDAFAQDEHLAALIAQSVAQARDIAVRKLNPTLFSALDWPEDIEQYKAYLRRFIRWIPQQSDNQAWRTSAPEDRYAKEVSDRLAHFFWLIDQKVDVDGTAIAENSDRFRDWLTQFARQWGSFLDTPESFNQDILSSFLRDAPDYTIEESLTNGRPNMPSGWLSFNQFFARQLNPGLRPIADPGHNQTITSPADCSFKHTYEIDENSNIPDVEIKTTHRYGNIAQLIDGSKYADTFAGGTFAHYMLPPSAYHRFHVPVAGRLQESFVIQGKVFMQVELHDQEFNSKDSTQTGYEFFQTRGVITIDTSGSEAGDLGIVGVIPVGMSHVASVVLTAVPGHSLAKGDEFGYFQFGGSDIILLFQAGVQPQIDTNPTPRVVGSVVGRLEPASQPAQPGLPG